MTGQSEERRLHPALFVLLVLLALLIGGFSLFVGYHKAMSPAEVLAQNSAWTVHLPVWLGRAVGWAELLAAALLFLGLPLRRFARAGLFAAIWITLNHAAAAVIHVIHEEWHTMTQSAVVITLCLVMVGLYQVRTSGIQPNGGN